MDFEFMKDLMGDAYKEGLTSDEVKTFMTGKNFADLSTGKYVDTDKYNNAMTKMNDLQEKLKTANNNLKSKMTEDEQIVQAQKDKDAEIERLTNLLKENTISSNKNVVVSELSSSRDILELDVADKDFQSFVTNITSENSETSTNVAKYVSKLVKDAYEKGKKDSTKDAMGNFGKGAAGQGSVTDELGALGKEIAKSSIATRTNFDYFKK